MHDINKGRICQESKTMGFVFFVLNNINVRKNTTESSNIIIMWILAFQIYLGTNRIYNCGRKQISDFLENVLDENTLQMS